MPRIKSYLLKGRVMPSAPSKFESDQVSGTHSRPPGFPKGQTPCNPNYIAHSASVWPKTQ